MAGTAVPLPEPDTRESLLAAATLIFAGQGYRAARVRDIAERAGANLAAINYHFGGKKQLYQAVLRRQSELRFHQHPLLRPEQLDAPPTARLTAIVEAFFGRLFDDGVAAQAPQLIMRELADPTESIDFIVQEIIGPQFRQVAAVVGELLGDETDQETIKRATFSVIGQCLFYRLAQPVASRVAPEFYDNPQALARTAVHIAEFSIEGLKAIRHLPRPAEDEA